MLERAQYDITYLGEILRMMMIENFLFGFILEINDLCSADEVLNEFQGDFDSLYGYESYT
jgi:hypothetical protein